MFGYGALRFPAPRRPFIQCARKSTGDLHPRHPLRVAAPRPRVKRSRPPENRPLPKQKKTDETQPEEKVPAPIIPALNVNKVDYQCLIQTEAKDVDVLERVLLTPAVWNIMGKYLNFSDLKSCRLVSTKLNRLVMDATNFIDRAIANVKPNVLNPKEFGRTKEAWKTMKISINRICGYQSCSSTFHDSDWLLPLLTEVEELTMESGATCLGPSKEYFGPSPIFLLSNTPKLVKLTMHPSLLRHYIFSTCQKHLSKLTHFKVSNQSPEAYCSDELIALQQLDRGATNLKVFESSVYFGIKPVYDTNLYSIARILQTNQASLSTLKYCGQHMWEPKGYSCKLRLSNFPALRIFQVTISLHNKNEVIEFLKTQPSLEEIELDLRSTKFSIPFPKGLLQVISTYHAGTLKALRIDAMDFSSILASDWRFLKKTVLQELSLWPLDEHKLYSVAPIKNDECMVDIFQYLPPTIQKIRLHGSNSKKIQSIPIHHFLQIHPKSFTHLCLSRVHGALTELALKYIFRNLTMLRVLHLANLDDSITDFAFIAKDTSTKLAASCITNLKGLRSLTLRKCGKITDRTLTEAIKFKELQNLDVSFNPEVTVDGCMAVARQNPSLEFFVNDHMTVFPSEETRRVTFPRLTCLKKWTHDADIVCTDQKTSS